MRLVYPAPMTEIDPSLRSQVETWIAEDPDPRTQEELRALLRKGDASELADRFRGTLEFGTAGLRGIVGGGPNRMNRAVVLRATRGLCAWLEMQVPDARERGVCIGYDGRIDSQTLAEDTAAVVAAAGLPVHVFDRVTPTPVLAFAVRHLDAAAGVMVTASHNPPEYNGYKVYWENAAQIIPPHDEGIAGCIAAAPAANAVPYMRRADAEQKGLRKTLGDAVIRKYLDGVRALAVHGDVPPDVTIAYTALHGVGDVYVREALAERGFTRVHSVPEQAQPDGRFPTVAFPNPEEDGAMDLVIALAREHGAELVLANDPDADRLAVAVREASGEYVMLTGNEIGCMLAHYVLSEGQGENRMVLSSVVSSPWLGSIAEAHGAHFEQTLTGFKWIANRALELSRDRELRLALGYEEALGYTVGELVRDKDGVSAAVTMAEMAAFCRARGRTLLDERELMWRRYGMFLSKQISVVLPGAEGAARIQAIMDAVRNEPPAELGGREIVATSDLLSGRRIRRDAPAEPTGFPPSNVIILDVRGGHRVMLRPSGTEPKIKFYFDVRVDVKSGEPIAEARARGEDLLGTLVESFRRKYGA